jgi:hypothetical protein
MIVPLRPARPSSNHELGHAGPIETSPAFLLLLLLLIRANIYRKVWPMKPSSRVEPSRAEPPKCPIASRCWPMPNNTCPLLLSSSSSSSSFSPLLLFLSKLECVCVSILYGQHRPLDVKKSELGLLLLGLGHHRRPSHHNGFYVISLPAG